MSMDLRGWSVKGEQQQNYRTIDQGVTSDGLSPDAHRRPSNSQLFPYVAVWMCSGLFWLIRSDAVIKLSGASRTVAEQRAAMELAGYVSVRELLMKGGLVLHHAISAGPSGV